ncbi:MAG: hypothetical protein CMQ29_00885 [Gammaproteobacteria bacterium]|nr:hypothetical protein [Gammaproteobacteria bacterium]
MTAGELGFDSCWFPEHHSSNYSLFPSPLLMAAHCAAATNQIRLGTGVIVAPLHKPIRVLAEIGITIFFLMRESSLGLPCSPSSYGWRRSSRALPANLVNQLNASMKLMPHEQSPSLKSRPPPTPTWG